MILTFLDSSLIRKSELLDYFSLTASIKYFSYFTIDLLLRKKLVKLKALPGFLPQVLTIQWSNYQTA